MLTPIWYLTTCVSTTVRNGYPGTRFDTRIRVPGFGIRMTEFVTLMCLFLSYAYACQVMTYYSLITNMIQM